MTYLDKSLVSYQENILQPFKNSEVFYDCEFTNSGTYNFDLAVVQLYQSEWKNSVIISDLTLVPWEELMSKTLVFHDANADLNIFCHQAGDLPPLCLDTQIALALLTPKLKMSFAYLVERYLKIELDKSQTRTNWHQRALSKEQLIYAHNDVFYLAEAYPLLIKDLKKQNRYYWWLEECQVERDKIKNKRFYWFNLHSASYIFGNKNAIKIAHVLTEAREKIAIKSNINRNSIFPDSEIMKIAQSNVKTFLQLAELIDDSSLMWNELAFIDENLFHNVQPAPIPFRASTILSPQQTKQRSTILNNASRLAEKLNINSAILCNERDATNYVTNPNKLNRLTNSWRKEFLLELCRNI